MKRLIFLTIFSFSVLELAWADNGLISPAQLDKFVDEIPDIPIINGYDVVNGHPVAKTLRIGMFSKKWKFHRDLPPTRVFAFGVSKEDATIPGPTIEAYQGIGTNITWENHLPEKHILPFDPTIPTATPRRPNSGVPTVVHLHGHIGPAATDGHATSWFTSQFRHLGPSWSQKTYHYNNMQHPGTLWYHDHAMGLTRVNLLAGLVGTYVIRQLSIERPLGLPTREFERMLVVFDRAFRRDGSIFMNSTGNNPSIHPQWQPEYFGDVIVVNGKAWPHMTVKRRKYRFRIINASNARFFKFFFDDGLPFLHIGSDSAYNKRPVPLHEFLLSPSEIADVVVDFSTSKSESAILRNGAPYPYPSGDPVNEANGEVMKFIVEDTHEPNGLRIPEKLIEYYADASSDVKAASATRYIALYEYTSPTDEPTHLYINGVPFEAPTTETPKVGSMEVWYVINLTEDNHPLHIHLGLFIALEQTMIVGLDRFKACMLKKNDAVRCRMMSHASGKRTEVPTHEKGWKNVFKMMPGHVTKILVRFSYIHTNKSYSFDATKEPGYVYHCHILDHEDNVMMRPLKLTH